MNKKDAYYFPHFSNARHDRKIKRIIKELGVEGYGIYFMLLEVLREQSDLRFPIADIDLLADEFRTSEAKIHTIISKYDLFEIDQEEMFFSPKQIKYLQPYFERSQRARDAANKRWDAQKQLPEVCETDANADANALQMQSDGNASKVKYSKVKESKDISIRKQKFYDEIATHKDSYHKQLLRDFYDYWIETDDKGNMRYEKEKTWDTNLRLKRWDRTNKKFGGTESSEPQQKGKFVNPIFDPL